MTENLPAKIYTEADLAKTRRKAKLAGFIQGGAAVFLVGLILRFMSWVPIVLGVAAVAYGAYKLLTWGKKDESEKDA